MEEFGKRIKDLRANKGLTQSEFSERLGIHLQTVSKWERGISEPDISVLGDISVILGVSLEKLVGTGDGEVVYSGGFDAVALGKKIAQLRRRRDESQSTFAAAVGVSADTVSKWERGVVCPSIDGLAQLAWYFGTPLSELYFGLGDEEERQSPPTVRLRKKRLSRAIIAVISSVAAALTAVVVVLAVLLTHTKTYTVIVDGMIYEATDGDWFTFGAAMRTGYDFVEFRDGDGNAVTFPVRVVGNAEYFSVYAPHEYTIDYWLNGGTFDGTATAAFTVEDDAIELSEPKKAGASFEGWYLSADYSGQALTHIIPSAAGLSLYAKWSDHTYTVRYELGGGALFEPNPVTVTREAEHTLNNPIRSGYLFLGWYDAQSGGEIQLSVGGQNARNITLYAVWQRSDALFRIDYDLGGGTLDKPNPTAVGAGEIASLNSPSKRGYDFTGWFDNTGGRGTKYAALYGLQDDIKLYAVYVPKTYTVVYKLNGGAYENEVNPNRMTYVEAVVLQPVYKYGHTFIGWAANGEDGERVTRLDENNIEDIFELYALFERNTYTVTLDADGGVFEIDGAEYGKYSFSVVFDDELFLPECTRAGFVFNGFADAQGRMIDKIDATNIGNITLTAAYRPAEYAYSIAFDLGGGVLGENPLTVACNQIVKLPIPTRDGYLFLGWNERADGSGAYYERSDKQWESDMTLHAVWQELTVSGSSKYFEYQKGAAQVKITKYIGAFGENVDVIVPSYIDGLPVVEVGFGTDYVTGTTQVQYLHSVVLPSTLRVLSEKAFKCIAVSEPITIPKSVTAIGKYAFWQAGIKINFEPGSALKEIGESAFEQAYFDAPLTLPEGIERLCSNAFCDAVIFEGALFLPSTLKVIERYALKIGAQNHLPYSASVEACIYLPDGIQKIERGAFGDEDYVTHRFVFTTMSREQTDNFPSGWDKCAFGGVRYIEHATSTLVDGGVTVGKLSGAFMLPERSKDGCTFVGWMDENGCIVNTYHIPKNGDETLTAYYEPIAENDGRDYSRPMALEIGKTYEVLTTPKTPFYFALAAGRYTVEITEVVSYSPKPVDIESFAVYLCREPLPSTDVDYIYSGTAFNGKSTDVFAVYNDVNCLKVKITVAQA